MPTVKLVFISSGVYIIVVADQIKEKVLITGANGFVGSHLCRAFLDEGYHVIAGVREGCDISMIEDLDLEYRFGDITLPKTLPEMVSGVDYIVHNAGLVKARDPKFFYTVNKQGTANIMAAAADVSGLKKLIYISSGAAAGPSYPGKILTEAEEAHPLTEYGRSKLAGEQAVLNLIENVNSVIVRPSGVYGPGDKEMLAFFQIVDSRIRPYIGKLNRRLRLIHVEDLARSVVCAVKAKTKSGSIYFIAESRSYSFREMIHILVKASGRFGLPIYVPGFTVKVIAGISESVMRMFGKTPMFTMEKAREILASWEISSERAEAELGFKASINFTDGARETLYWYRMEAWL